MLNSISSVLEIRTILFNIDGLGISFQFKIIRKVVAGTAKQLPHAVKLLLLGILKASDGMTIIHMTANEFIIVA